VTNARPDWWDGFFDGLMADFWRAVIPPEATASEAAFLEKALRLASGSRVLDVPCGHGRHALELARRGYRVSGVDLSADLLGAARSASAREGLPVEWVPGDMRNLPQAWSGTFDGAYCAGNAFGYFDDAGNQAFLAAVARALRPGGRFVLESGWVAESLLPQFRDRLDMKAGGIRFQAENRYDPVSGYVENVFTASRGGETTSRPARHRLYTCRQLLEMLASAGFEAFELFGSPAGEPFALGSPRLLAVATRSQAAGSGSSG
jgi:SAM-dependent methyltransferase